MPRFNPLVDGLAPPPVPAVQAWARSYRGAHGPLIDLSQAVPGYPPHPDLLAWLGEAAASPACSGYGEIEGDRSLRAAYADHQAVLYGAWVAAEHIHVTSGCNQAFVVAALAVAGAGDAILMTDPCYFNHETSLRMLGIGTRYVRCLPANGFLPSPSDVAEAITPDVRALAIVSPNNPTGAVYPPELLSELLDLCRARGIWLILDETYRDFLPPDARRPHALFATPDWHTNLIGLYSFSKSFCIPGHRLGAITAGTRTVEQIAKIMDNVEICAPRPPQAAVAKALPALASWREENRSEIARRADALQEAIAEAPGWEIGAMGAYFAFVRHPMAGVASADAARLLATEHGIVTIPGTFFGSDNERYLRFAFANADVPTIRTLSRRLPAGP